MPSDGTPRQHQALEPGGREQGGSQSEFPAGGGGYGEQVFAGECGDPIWEGRRAGEHKPSQRVPRPGREERVAAGKIIDLGRGRDQN